MTISPLAGMEYAQSQVERSASRIANLPAAPEQPGGDVVDLSSEMVALMQAKNDFAANAKAFTVMD